MSAAAKRGALDDAGFDQHGVCITPLGISFTKLARKGASVLHLVELILRALNVRIGHVASNSSHRVVFVL